MTGMEAHSIAVGFTCTAAVGAACVLGGLMVYSMRILSKTQPTALSIILGSSGYILLSVAFSELLLPSQQQYEEYMQHKGVDVLIAKGCSHLFAIMSVIIGILMVFSANASVQKLSSIGTEERRRHGRHLATVSSSVSSLSQVEVIVNALSPSPVSRTRAGSDPCAFDRLPSVASFVSHVENPCVVGEKPIPSHIDMLSVSAVVLHTIPGGAAVYVAALHRTSVAVALALGMGLHSIPDGIALSSSIYCATGKRYYGVLWCVIVSLSRLVGALIAWLFLGSSHHGLPYAVFVGMSTGVLVGTSMKEILPTTYNYAGGKSHLIVIGVVLGILISSFGAVVLPV